LTPPQPQRRQRVRACEQLPAERGASDSADPAREAHLSELRAELGECLQGISPDQARVVVMKDALGFSFEEISTASGMPVGTAKCYAHRGRSRLRERLAGRAVA
jgi:RNA polymerase sigma-70 factor (ECF subfamily)